MSSGDLFQVRKDHRKELPVCVMFIPGISCSDVLRHLSGQLPLQRPVYLFIHRVPGHRCRKALRGCRFSPGLIRFIPGSGAGSNSGPVRQYDRDIIVAAQCKGFFHQFPGRSLYIFPVRHDNFPDPLHGHEIVQPV